jgi:hypothetical protein
VRCALQVNPYGYLADHGKGSAYADEATYNAALIEACKKNDVEVIAVTDHYKIDSAAGLISDAEKAGITVFPGFEAVSSDGVHLLVLFEGGTPATRINMCIGACDLHDHDDPSPTSKDHDAVSLMEKADRDWGAMVIAAHAAGEGGLLAHLKGRRGSVLGNPPICSQLPCLARGPTPPKACGRSSPTKTAPIAGSACRQL